jgi:uncharacterized protein YndB with AHSA1/START domain
MTAADAVITGCELPDAPEKVWRALTVPELLAASLMPNDIPTRERRPEGAITHSRRDDALRCSLLHNDIPMRPVEW